MGVKYKRIVLDHKTEQMKQFFKLLTLLVFTQISILQAQTSDPGKKGRWELDASLNPGIGLSSSRFVIGADLQLERYLSDKLALTFSGGFTHFSNKLLVYNFNPGNGFPPTQFKVSTDRNLIPVKLGVKVFPVNRFYLEGAGGIGVDINGNSSFVVSATAGIKLGKRFDLGIKYEDYTNFYKTNQLSLRLTYRIF